MRVITLRLRPLAVAAALLFLLVAGGFSAKARAAVRVGAQRIVIGRKEREEGSSVSELLARLKTLSRGE